MYQVTYLRIITRIDFVCFIANPLTNMQSLAPILKNVYPQNEDMIQENEREHQGNKKHDQVNIFI